MAPRGRASGPTSARRAARRPAASCCECGSEARPAEGVSLRMRVGRRCAPTASSASLARGPGRRLSLAPRPTRLSGRCSSGSSSIPSTSASRCVVAALHPEKRERAKGVLFCLSACGVSAAILPIGGHHHPFAAGVCATTGGCQERMTRRGLWVTLLFGRSPSRLSAAGCGLTPMLTTAPAAAGVASCSRTQHGARTTCCMRVGGENQHQQ